MDVSASSSSNTVNSSSSSDTEVKAKPTNVKKARISKSSRVRKHRCKWQSRNITAQETLNVINTTPCLTVNPNTGSQAVVWGIHIRESTGIHPPPAYLRHLQKWAQIVMPVQMKAVSHLMTVHQKNWNVAPENYESIQSPVQNTRERRPNTCIRRLRVRNWEQCSDNTLLHWCCW